MTKPAKTTAREYAIVLIALAVVGVFAWWLFGLTWRTTSTPGEGLMPAQQVEYSGRLLYPYAGFIGVVALAAVAGILATKRFGRIVIGALLAIFAGSACIQIVLDSGVEGVAAAAELSLALISILGVVTAVRGGRWQMMGSRYERGNNTKADESAWDVLDRGDDPTL